jgi:hypothetical protein
VSISQNYNFILKQFPTIRFNVFLQRLFFYRFAGTSAGRSSNRRKNNLSQKTIFAAIWAVGAIL